MRTFLGDATLRGFRRRIRIATPSELRTNECELLAQGCKRNPGLELANAFSALFKSTDAFSVLSLIYQTLSALLDLFHTHELADYLPREGRSTCWR